MHCREEDDRLAPRLPLAVPEMDPPPSSRLTEGTVTAAPAASELFESSIAGGRLSIRQSVSFTVNSST